MKCSFTPRRTTTCLWCYQSCRSAACATKPPSIHILSAEHTEMLVLGIDSRDRLMIQIFYNILSAEQIKMVLSVPPTEGRHMVEIICRTFPAEYAAMVLHTTAIRGCGDAVNQVQKLVQGAYCKVLTCHCHQRVTFWRKSSTGPFCTEEAAI